MEMQDQQLCNQVHQQFKIDLIVWKYEMDIEDELKRAKFKIDLIVWKCKTSSWYQPIQRRLKQT